MTRTVGDFSMVRDMDFDFVTRLSYGTETHGAITYMVGKAEHSLWLRHDDRTIRDKAMRAIRELVRNAFVHVRRCSVDSPWSVLARREDEMAVWTISDTGPGILARYVSDERRPMLRDVEPEGVEMLLSLIHDQRTSHYGDPNAGIGLEIAVREASRSGCSLELRSDGFVLELRDGRMTHVADDDTIIGTTWTVRVPMTDRSAPRPRVAVPIPEVAPNVAPNSVQEAVDMAEGGLVYWINSAWTGRVPGDARDFRRSAGAHFDQLRQDLGLQAMPPAHADCAPDDLKTWARFGDHPLDERILRIVAEDPVIRRAIDPFQAEDMLSGLVHRLRLLVIDEATRNDAGKQTGG